MKIQDCFDLALLHGHSAMEQMGFAWQQKQNNDCAAAMAGSSNLAEIGKLHIGQKNLFKHLASAIILFQAMMEAIINYSLNEFDQLDVVQGKSFADKWKQALQFVKADTDHFNQYFSDIYRPLRVGLTHPSPQKLQALNNVDFESVYSGLKSGLLTYESLFEKLGHPHDQNSWEILCKSNKVPATI